MPRADIDAKDRAEILDVLGRYLWAVDTGDHAGVMAVFSPDGVVRYGTGERYEGAEGLARFATRVIGDRSIIGRMHLNHPLFFTARSDSQVSVRSYVVAIHHRPGREAETVHPPRTTEDTFVRTDAGWRIKERAIFLWADTAREAPRAHS